MDMEDLLCPQVCMDVDDTPIDLGASNGNKGKGDSGSDTDESTEIPLDVRIKILMEEDDFLDRAQIPEELTEAEIEKKTKMFQMGPAVQFMKQHCTSCNTHIGSAPVEQFNRYIHPLLHVLQCKDCYDFYCSGDFDKDEDGSELYCRWCGQGGKVMCCSGCCHVFCQKCVRNNLGKKTLDAIKNSDDWICFICNPEQLMNLKILCYALFHYVQQEIKTARETNNPSLLKEDHTMCCNRTPKLPMPTKRKRSTSDDVPFNPYSEEVKPEVKKKRVVDNNASVLQKVLTSFRNPENPPTFTPRAPWAAQGMRPNTFLKVRPIGPRPPIPIAPKVAVRNPILLCTTTNRPLTNARAATVVPARAIPGRAVPLANSSFRIISTNQQQAPLVPINNNRTVLTGLVSKVRPGSKHAWFDHAARSTNSIVSTLSKKLLMYENDQVNATSIEQLAVIHNKLQELLSGSVNSLIGVRKNLRNEFLAEINKFKVVKNAPAAETNQPPPLVKINAPKPQKDDDVIFVNNDEDPLAIKENEVPEDAEEEPADRPRTFIKVKPVSSLIDSSRLPDYERKLNGVTEQIDLCDDEDDIVEVKEDAPPKNEDVAKEAEAPATEEATSSPEMDSETMHQIRRALAESKFESLMQENSKIPVDKSISSRELRRLLSVRVILAPSYKRKKRAVEKPAQIFVEQDFEEMLSGSFVLNTSKQNLGSTEVKGSSEDESDAESTTIESNNVPEASEPKVANGVGETLVESTARNDLQASSKESMEVEGDAAEEDVSMEETAQKDDVTNIETAAIVERAMELLENNESAAGVETSKNDDTNIESTASVEASKDDDTNIESTASVEASKDDDTNIEGTASIEASQDDDTNTSKVNDTSNKSTASVEASKDEDTNIESTASIEASKDDDTNTSKDDDTNIEDAACTDATKEDDASIEKLATTESSDFNPFLQLTSDCDVGDSLSKAPSEPSRFDHSSTDTIATTDSGIELDPKLP